MKKFALLILTTVVLFSLLPSQAQDLNETEWVCPSGFEGETLRIFNWSTYIGDGVIGRFEELCNVKVEYFEFASNDELITVLRNDSAAYDVVFPSSNAVTRLIVEELVQPLDHDLLPNLKNLARSFEDRPHDPGFTHSVPYQWGTVGIAIDRSLIDDDQFQTWADFFAYEGRVAWIDDYRMMLGIALITNGADANTTNEADIQAAADFLLAAQNDVFEIAPDTGQDLLLRGEVDAVIEWSGDVYQIIADCDCDDYAYIIPNNGTNVWIDGMAIPTTSPNPQLAHAFLDFMMDPIIAATNSNYIQYATPNEAALPYIDPELRSNPAIYPNAETVALGFLLLDQGEAEPLYEEAWTRVITNLDE